MRSFAIIPAAGRSARMGSPKLRLPWGDGTVIEGVVAAWRASRVTKIVAVVHPDDVELAELARRAGADVVVPDVPPADMKASILRAIEFVRTHFAPTAADAWLVAPADMPQLASGAIDRLLDAFAAQPGTIFAPSHEGRRGHPVLLPWSLAGQVARLGENEGLNTLLESRTVREIAWDEPSVVEDIDTPEDYARLRKRHNA